jgi:hypothetical protein
MPMADFKKWLNAKDSKEKEALQTGIPTDSVDKGLRTGYVDPFFPSCKSKC